MHGVVNIDDLRKLAKKRLPKIAYDFIEGGTDDEVALTTNEQAFRQARVVRPEASVARGSKEVYLVCREPRQILESSTAPDGSPPESGVGPEGS